MLGCTLRQAPARPEVSQGGSATCVRGLQRRSSSDGQLQRRVGAACGGGGIAALSCDREGMEVGNNSGSSSCR